MKILPATALLAFSMGCVLFAVAHPQQAIAACRDNSSGSGCVSVLPHNEIRVISDLATQQHPASLVAKTATLSPDAAATASAVAPLGLFGSTLVLIGYFGRKRSVHRQRG